MAFLMSFAFDDLALRIFIGTFKAYLDIKNHIHAMERQ